MTEQKVLSFDEFLAADQVAFQDVKVPGGIVRIGSVTAEDWIVWTEMRESPEGRKTSGALLISRSMVDAEGKRIGDESKLSLIQKMNLKTTETLLRAIFKLNGMDAPTGAIKNV